jgi:uncharacterized protein YjbJ (UPF0337 family)
MGMFDDIKKKAQDLAGQHGDKAKDAVDKGADYADDKTGGKYSDHIDKGSDATKDAIDKVAGDDDTEA